MISTDPQGAVAVSTDLPRVPTPIAAGPPPDSHAPGRTGPLASRALWWSLTLDAGLAPMTFYTARGLGLGIRDALLAATGVATVRVVGTAIRNRRVDAIAAFVLGSYAVMLTIAFLAHDERLLLARDPISSALAGVVFLGSCAVGRPAMELLSQRIRLPHQARQPDPARRRARTVQTAVWGTVLLVESAGRLALLYSVPITAAVGVSQLIEPVVLIALAAWSIRYARRTT